MRLPLIIAYFLQIVSFWADCLFCADGIPEAAASYLPGNIIFYGTPTVHHSDLKSIPTPQYTTIYTFECQ